MNTYKKLKSIILFSVFIVTSSIVNSAVLTTYYHNDLLGSPIAATDENGYKLWTEDYKPYGERTINNINSDKNTMWFTGKPQDTISGLSYFGARYYDPKIGRFMGVDPVGARAGDVHNFNRYVYANNNPYRYVDPDGRAAVDTLKVVWNLPSTLYNSAPLAIDNASSSFANGVGYVGREMDSHSGDVVSFFMGFPAGRFPAGAYASAARSMSSFGRVGGGVATGTKLLGSPITWNQKDLARVISKHGPNTSGKGGLLKSRFLESENIEKLIQQGTHMPRVKQASGKNFQRVFDVGRNIGTDVSSGNLTSIMTIVTQPSGRLVTSFPGSP